MTNKQFKKITVCTITFLIYFSLSQASAHDVETGYGGEIKQLSDTKTPYNTVLMDSRGKISLWSFEVGEYADKLSIETTALNNIFSLPQMLVSQNKDKIIEVIKTNPKFSKMQEYYREYLKTGKSSKLTYYLKFRDSIMLDLIEYNKANKLF
jgi:hypothetical protein